MHKKSSLLILGGLTFGTAAIGMALVNPGVRAAGQGSATASVTVDTVCSMTATVNSAHTVTLSSGTYSGTANPDGIGETSIETFCNDQDGYAIYAVGYTNNVPGNNKLIGTGLGSSADIITGTATGPNGNNDISNWAMKVSAGAGTDAPSILNGFGSFSAVPNSYTKVASLDHATTSSILKTTYAAYISATQPAGTYTGQVKYVLVNPNTAAAPYMQNVTAAYLESQMPNNGDTTKLADSRDGNEYQITNIDGTYWMTDNLKIMGTISTSESNFTGADFNISAGGDLTVGDTYTEPRAHFNTSDANSATYGAYYNYCAASAGTVCNNTTKQDATVDICPKGWRLPTRTEAQAFVDASSPNKNPVLAGLYGGGSLYEASSGGYWWSATATFDSAQYNLHYFDSNWETNFIDKSYGFSVRCVYGPLPPTMQNVDSTKLAELMPTDGSTTTLPDSRDGNVYNIARIGNTYWMTDNLKIMGIISASESNFTGADFYISAGGDLAAGDTYTEPRAHFNTSDTNSSTYGAYYNYCAASAGTVCSDSVSQDATSDICPKGWRLPTQAEVTTIKNNNSTNFNPILAGGYSEGLLYNASSTGFWWLATALDANYQFVLDYSGSSWGGGGISKVNGYSVRCMRSL